MSDKILVADDEPNLLRLVGYSLHLEGYDVIVAQDGEEALNKIRTEKPALVVLDVNMPKMDGLEVCQKIRENPETANLPIIMLSARAQSPDKVTGLQAGADEYVAKPVPPEELVARVGALLKRTRRLSQVTAAPVGKILSFIGAKGGVGTTTVAINVAAALVRQKKNVAAVELRPYYGTLSAHLGDTAARNLGGLLALAPERITERELAAHLSTTGFGLRVLLGPQDMKESTEIEPDKVDAIVKGLAGVFDYVVLDLPCQPSKANEAAIRCCESVTLVVEAEPSCMAAAKITLAMLESWGVAGSLVGIVVVNRVHLTVPMSLTEIKSQLNCNIAGIMPPAAEACVAAVTLGAPIVVSKPDTVAASSLAELADRLVSGEVGEQFV